MIAQTLRDLWLDPRPPRPTTAAWWDWALAALLVPAALLEGLLRPDVMWRPLSIVLGVVAALAIAIRRERPLLAALVAVLPLQVAHLAATLAGHRWEGLHMMACLLLLPYSLFRWAAAWEAIVGMLPMLFGYAMMIVGGHAKHPGEYVAAAIVMFFPAVLGAAVRFRAAGRVRELERVKLLEREQLARELHDTVAHHVSAIAIQAQAARALSDKKPEAALDALKIIEEAAGRSLAELRGIVRALRRDDEAAELAPQQQGIEAIERLAGAAAGARLRVDVETEGDLDDLPASVGAALYRLAQESITNAVKHARGATRVTVRVAGDADCVRLTVRDNGAPVGEPTESNGYGLVGMAERVALLGGTFSAGPQPPERHFTVSAMLPRHSE
ncbi:MAG: sensor histidine kinase [Myxococcales bacterium]|nr:sensor histidine kinase [Myxococcales bacterium]